MGVINFKTITTQHSMALQGFCQLLKSTVQGFKRPADSFLAGNNHDCLSVGRLQQVGPCECSETSFDFISAGGPFFHFFTDNKTKLHRGMGRLCCKCIGHKGWTAKQALFCQGLLKKQGGFESVALSKHEGQQFLASNKC